MAIQIGFGIASQGNSHEFRYSYYLPLTLTGEDRFGQVGVWCETRFALRSSLIVNCLSLVPWCLGGQKQLPNRAMPGSPQIAVRFG